MYLDATLGVMDRGDNRELKINIGGREEDITKLTFAEFDRKIFNHNLHR